MIFIFFLSKMQDCNFFHICNHRRVIFHSCREKIRVGLGGIGGGGGGGVAGGVSFFPLLAFAHCVGVSIWLFCQIFFA